MSRLRITGRCGPLGLALAASALLSCVGDLGGDPGQVKSVFPTRISARGGDALTLLGSGFTAATTVLLEGEPGVDLELVSSGEIHFKAPPLFAGPARLTVGSSDGAAELAGTVTVLPLDLRFIEAPPFALPVIPDGGAEAKITCAEQGDFDHDGDVDLITCAAGEPCRFVENDGRGNFTEAPPSADEPRFPEGTPDSRALVAADFDGDGDLDLFLGVGTGGPGMLLQNSGAASFTDVGTDALPADTDALSAVAVGDIDGDGTPDLVIGNSTPDSIPFRVYLNTSIVGGDTMSFALASEETIPAADWIVSAIALADVDGDKDLDIIVATPGASDGIALRLLQHDGDAFHEVPGGLPGGASIAVTAFAVGDVNGDGAVDLVLTGPGQDRLLVNDGTGHFFDATGSGMPLDASAGTSIALVDLDRDRDLDLVIGNAGAETRLYLNNGAGRFLDDTPLLPIRADETVWVGVANVDGDGDSDIVLLNAAPAPARLYLSVEPTVDAAH
jgi:VCBS repeat protein/IPT/TIG domain-containing protein